MKILLLIPLIVYAQQDQQYGQYNNGQFVQRNQYTMMSGSSQPQYDSSQNQYPNQFNQNQQFQTTQNPNQYNQNQNGNQDPNQFNQNQQYQQNQYGSNQQYQNQNQYSQSTQNPNDQFQYQTQNPNQYNSSQQNQQGQVQYDQYGRVVNQGPSSTPYPNQYNNNNQYDQSNGIPSEPIYDADGNQINSPSGNNQGSMNGGYDSNGSNGGMNGMNGGSNQYNGVINNQNGQNSQMASLTQYSFNNGACFYQNGEVVENGQRRPLNSNELQQLQSFQQQLTQYGRDLSSSMGNFVSTILNWNPSSGHSLPSLSSTPTMPSLPCFCTQTSCQAGSNLNSNSYSSQYIGTVPQSPQFDQNNNNQYNQNSNQFQNQNNQYQNQNGQFQNQNNQYQNQNNQYNNQNQFPNQNQYDQNSQYQNSNSQFQTNQYQQPQYNSQQSYGKK